MKSKLLKILGIIAISAALFALCAVSASAVDLSQLKFATNDDGTITITECDKEAEGELVIPDTIGGRKVTGIAGIAFSGCDNITKASLPSTVVELGDGAFMRCSSLEEVSLPDGLTYIGANCFSECTSLRSVTIPDSVTDLLYGSFNGCTSLNSVKLPVNLTKIQSGVFWGCTDLTFITIPASVTILDDYAFNSTGLKSVVIPGGVESIGTSAFAGCASLASVTLNEGLDSIGEGAFGHCTSLKSVAIPDSVTEIGQSAFEDCTALETVMIGKGVSKLYSGTAFGSFKNCTSLREVYIYPALQSIDRISFENCPAITDVYYCGTEEQWLSVQIGENNDSLLLADIHYIDSFKDVPTASWYGPAVLWAVGQNITNGIGNNAFAPSMTCTNAQVITFLYRAAGEPAVSGTSALTNVKNPDVYYYNPCVWAYQKGIITDVNFQPDGPATRGSFVTYLWRYEGKPAADGVANPFKDVKSGDECYTAVMWAFKNNITTGMSADTFSPDTTCSRGQIVTFLYRFFG